MEGRERPEDDTASRVGEEEAARGCRVAAALSWQGRGAAAARGRFGLLRSFMSLARASAATYTPVRTTEHDDVSTPFSPTTASQKAAADRRSPSSSASARFLPPRVCHRRTARTAQGSKQNTAFKPLREVNAHLQVGQDAKENDALKAQLAALSSSSTRATTRKCAARRSQRRSSRRRRPYRRSSRRRRPPTRRP